jgi:predicted nucleotidyltransferase
MEKIMFQDKKLLKIKEYIHSLFPKSKILLFGSRARGNFDDKSDYDVLVVIKEEVNIKEKRTYAGKIRKELAVKGIPIDVLVRTEKDVCYFNNKIGSVIREASKYGIVL